MTTASHRGSSNVAIFLGTYMAFFKSFAGSVSLALGVSSFATRVNTFKTQGNGVPWATGKRSISYCISPYVVGLSKTKSSMVSSDTWSPSILKFDFCS
jgi:hypothetical protein